MSVRRTQRAIGILVLVLASAAVVAGCRGTVFGREFEYEEEIFLGLDGSATVTVNASITAMVTLRGAQLDTDPEARVDRDAVREFYECPGVEVVRVSRPWLRDGRRFVQVRLDADDITVLSRCRAFSWATYAIAREQGTMRYVQRINAPASSTAAPGWHGGELVAVRIHLPSRISYHNAPSREVERGNILTWEQPIRNRLAGEVLDLDVRMDERSILRRTMTVFGIAVAAALLLLTLAVWWVRRKGRS